MTTEIIGIPERHWLEFLDWLDEDPSYRSRMTLVGRRYSRRVIAEEKDALLIDIRFGHFA